MNNLVQITSEISYLPASKKPFSCDIVIIKPNLSSTTWIFDVGIGKKARNVINSIESPKNIVLSHFHPDHILNLPLIKFTKADNLYVSSNTKKYTLRGTVVQKTLTFTYKSLQESSEVKLFLLPSSHAKGCLCIQYGQYCFTGDGTYCTIKHTYNEQLLRQEIEVLEKVDCKYFGLSHDKQFIYTKEELISLHKEIYSRHTAGNPTISVEDFFNPDGSVKER